ncbi:hypothetical protein THARTR1_09843 [Trichoderma harzianum]|uniref:Uncharacterized protein n=1 Tax=Trichoderma harzianum TaxID=5544 RepID=A0A2K0TVK8_TRIHA|nr:hypothetical protein THARTR1_09843 [Trichoderma harzianum]
MCILWTEGDLAASGGSSTEGTENFGVDDEDGLALVESGPRALDHGLGTENRVFASVDEEPCDDDVEELLLPLSEVDATVP